MNSDKLKILEILYENVNEESNRVNARFNILLVLNTGLLGTLSWIINSIENYYKPLVIIIFSVLGICCAIYWLFLIKFSRFYEKRWFADIEALISSDKKLKKWIKARNATDYRVKHPFNGKFNIIGISIILPVVFLFIWASIFLYGLNSFFYWFI